MKNIFTIFTLIIGPFMLLHTNAVAQQGNLKVGAGLAYGSGVFADAPGVDEIQNDLGIRVDGHYSFTSEIRVGADFLFYLPKTVEASGDELKASVWELNINGNYFFFQEEELSIYGLAGVNITGITQKESIGGQTEEYSESKTGLNLGAGLEYGLGFGDLFGELKLGNLGGDASQVVLGAGVRIGL